MSVNTIIKDMLGDPAFQEALQRRRAKRRGGIPNDSDLYVTAAARNAVNEINSRRAGIAKKTSEEEINLGRKRLNLNERGLKEDIKATKRREGLTLRDIRTAKKQNLTSGLIGAANVGLAARRAYKDRKLAKKLKDFYEKQVGNIGELEDLSNEGLNSFMRIYFSEIGK